MGNTIEFDLGMTDLFIARILDADKEGTLAFLCESLDDGASMEALVTGLLAPAMADLGRRWASSDIGVSESQASAMIVRGALLCSEPPATPTERPVVAVCCPQGEAHELAAELVAAVLRASGWPVDLLGAAGPADDGRTDPDGRKRTALMVSSTTPCRTSGTAPAPGGIAALRLADLRPGGPGGSCGGTADASPSDDGVDVLRHVAAAVLVDDKRVLLDSLSWGTALVGAREASTSGLAALMNPAVEETPTPLDGISQGNLGTTARPGSGNPAVRTRPVAAARPSAAAAGAPSPEAQQGQVFADLLFLAAMSCHAPMALISVVQPDMQWSTLSYGVERREALNEPALFAAIAASADPLELPDLAAAPHWRALGLLTGPLAVRHLYGVPLRSRSNATLGVFCVLDRQVRELHRREQQAMDAIARQVSAQIVLWRTSTVPKPVAAAQPGRRVTDRAGVERPGPDAALVDLLGLRRPGSGVEQHLLRSHEVAVLFDVTERTVINWAAAKKLASLRTAGGHLRFRSEDVLALLAGRSTPSPAQSN